MLLEKLMFINEENLPAGTSGSLPDTLENIVETMFHKQDVGFYIAATDVVGTGNILFRLVGMKGNNTSIFATSDKLYAKDFKLPIQMPLSHGGKTLIRFKKFGVQFNREGAIDGKFTIALSLGVSVPTYY